MDNLALRFVRWGTGLLVLGLTTGYGPLGHYLMGGAIPSCPAAPVHGHTILLGWVGMTIFGLVYRVLPHWANDRPPAVGVARVHFYLAIVGTLGAWANGTFGYGLLGLVSPGFYYSPDMPALQVWFGISGLFLSVYGLGCLLFLWVVLRSTGYELDGGAPTTDSLEAA